MATRFAIQAVVILMSLTFNEALVNAATHSKVNASVLPDYNIGAMAASDLAKAFEESLKDEHDAAEEEQILELQRKPQKSLVQPKVASAIPSKGKQTKLLKDVPLDGAVTQFEKDVTELVMGLSKAAANTDGNIMATPMGGTIATIQNLIESDLLPKIVKASEDSQTELTRLGDAVDKCSHTKADSLAKSSLHTYTAKSPLHKECRKAQAGLFTDGTSCDQELKTAKAEMKVACDGQAAVEKEVGSTTTNQHIAQKAVGETVHSYVDRLHTTFCGGKDMTGGFKDKLDTATANCKKATDAYNAKDAECKAAWGKWKDKKASCDGAQEEMDDAACKAAIDTKDTCEAYAECMVTTKKAYTTAEATIKPEEAARKKEYQGLKRMICMIETFADGTVSDEEIEACKSVDHSVEANEKLTLSYYTIPANEECAPSQLYPGSVEYKKAEFADLPTVAKGNLDGQCAGLLAISTIPATGSPASCMCERITLDGPYTPGALVKCTDCLPVSKTTDKISCPAGTKLFAPQSRQDWDTFFKSTTPLGNPDWIIDVTSSQKGCGGCTDHEMNSGNVDQASWKTSDGSPWWLRSSTFAQPSGDYEANCYMALGLTIKSSDDITFDDGKCAYSSKDYYCQTETIVTAPAAGSPAGCICTKVALVGEYSAKNLLKCMNCLDVSKSTEKNSCPVGTKLFSPASAEDWKTFIKSADELKDPSWIIDVTSPKDGCGGCTKHAMNSGKPEQATWVTSDGSPWWLRSSTYGEPNGDYTANCYLGLGPTPSAESAVTFSDGGCGFHSKSYYCQGKGSIPTTTTTTPEPAAPDPDPVTEAPAPSEEKSESDSAPAPAPTDSE